MKSIEINMSTLSQAQKKMCVELIAQSNIKFQQRDNQYVAQIKVNPKDSLEPKQKQNTKKVSISALNTGKKLLARAVKIGDLKRLEELHRTIEIYVFPKKMPLPCLWELIENSYEKFWLEHKKKSPHLKNINFPEWFYKHMIASLKDKLKAEQLLLNLIDSLNHFMPKAPALKIFYNFLSEHWPIDSLLYFLVLRGLLEQVTGDRILEKSNHNSLGTAFKLKSSPYEKRVSEEEVSYFLKVLYSGGLSCSRSKPKPLEGIYQALTQKMFWQESKRKNYIYFYDLLEHLVLQFMDKQASSCDMSISKTQFGDHSISELITEQHQNQSQFNKHIAQTVAPPEVYFMGLDPAEEERFQERQRQQAEVKTAESLSNAIFAKINQIYCRLNTTPSGEMIACIDSLVQSIINLDKSVWIRYRGEIGQSELYAVERLQALYRQQTQSGVITNQLIKNILLLPPLREQIVIDLGI